MSPKAKPKPKAITDTVKLKIYLLNTIIEAYRVLDNGTEPNPDVLNNLLAIGSVTINSTLKDLNLKVPPQK